MQTLDRAMSSWQGRARQIEIPFTRWANLVDFRTGDIAVLAGAPGGGKSLTALNWAWRSHDPILYLVQDSPRSVYRRLTALATNMKVADIREEEAEHWGERIRGVRPELIIGSGSHSVEMVEHKIIAMAEWLQETPRVVMIDNLIDMRSESGLHMDTAFYADILPKLKQVAIDYDVGMILLHHVKRHSDNAGKPSGAGDQKLQMTDLLFGGEREARHVWGVYRGWDDRNIKIQILKQQDGQARNDGSLEVELSWLPPEGRLYNA